MRWLIGAASLLICWRAIAAARRFVWRARVRDSWLHEQARRETRNTFDGVSIRWPINKVLNEHSTFNTRRLRRRA